MEFDGVNFALGIFDGGDGVLRAAHGSKPGRESHDMVAVAVPDAQRVGKFGKELGFMIGIFNIQNGAAIFAARRRLHFPAQVIGEPLHAIADSEHRNAEREHARVAFGGLRVVDRPGPTGKHDAGGFELADFIERRGARKNGGEDLLLANAAGNELGVLAAEIEHDYTAAFRVGAFVAWLHLGSAGHYPPVGTAVSSALLVLGKKAPATVRGRYRCRGSTFPSTSNRARAGEKTPCLKDTGLSYSLPSLRHY